MKPAVPQSDLYARLALLGWSLGKIEFKNGVYVAKASSEQTGQSIERTGKSPENALAAVYQFAARSNQIRRFAAIQKTAAWGNHFVDRMPEIAQAYSKLPQFDEKAVPHWKALAAESKIQADAIRQQLKVEVVDDPDPYPNAEAMCHDVHQNKHFKVSRANSEHPLWTQEDNINFRIVHDVLGHCQSGGDFSWHGENLACGTHFPLVSPQAREALMTECLGQTGYAQHYHGFGPQKVGLMSEFLHPAQAKEGEHVWVPHGGLPDLAMAPNQNAPGTMNQAPGEAALYNSPGQWVNPQQFPSHVMSQPDWLQQGFVPTTASTINPVDPNASWTPEGEKADFDPQSDYLGIGEAADNAMKIDTGWHNEDESTQNQAIMNAFRVALLSPRKHLRWNAAHYQAIQHTDPSTKARDLWDVLENDRVEHNKKLGFPEHSHLAYRKQLEYLQHVLEERDGLDSADAYAKAKEIVFNKTREFEEQIEAENLEQGTEESELRRYNDARRRVTEWMKANFDPGQGWQAPVPGQMALAAADTADTLFNPEETGDWKPIDMSGFSNQQSKYGAFMGGHLDAIEKVGQHINEIRKAAQHDIQKENGRGFYFRNAIMNMNLPGVGPKVASFVWLLLAPMTSELGIIDTHIMRGLRRPENGMNDKDYYKYERMQRTAKDATGYGHVPLGLYHWGLWDYIRNQGQHSDHSPLRILDPLPWDSPDAKWDAASNAKAGIWDGGPTFEAARGPMEETARRFDEEFAQHPSGKIPLTTMPGMV